MNNVCTMIDHEPELIGGEGSESRRTEAENSTTADSRQFSSIETRLRTNSEAIQAGLAFLTSAWRDHRWRDFTSAAGGSDVWVTAHVLARLAELPSSYISFAMRQQMEDSLNWLDAQRIAQGGWGFSTKSPADADSTAWSILALRRHRRTVPAEALEFISQCRAGNGGIALLPQAAPAPDVTAVAVNASASRDPEALRFLTSCWLKTDENAPPARIASPLYVCSVLVDWPAEQVPGWVLNKVCELTATHDQKNAFEQAVLLRCLSYLRMQKAWSAGAELRRMQLADGGWPSSAPLLRQREGEPVLDDQRVFTTITAVSALAAAESQPGLYFGSDRPAPERLNPRNS